MNFASNSNENKLFPNVWNQGFRTSQIQADILMKHI